MDFNANKEDRGNVRNTLTEYILIGIALAAIACIVIAGGILVLFYFSRYFFGALWF